jgi:hypothetical protein
LDKPMLTRHALASKMPASRHYVNMAGWTADLEASGKMRGRAIKSIELVAFSAENHHQPSRL